MVGWSGGGGRAVVGRWSRRDSRVTAAGRVPASVVPDNSDISGSGRVVAGGSHGSAVLRRAWRPTILICRAVLGPAAGRCCTNWLTWTFTARRGAVNVHASRNGNSGARYFGMCRVAGRVYDAVSAFSTLNDRDPQLDIREGGQFAGLATATTPPAAVLGSLMQGPPPAARPAVTPERPASTQRRMSDRGSSHRRSSQPGRLCRSRRHADRTPPAAVTSRLRRS